MKVYILGMDGYLGWPLRDALLEAGHTVEGCDNFVRRHTAKSLVPLTPTLRRAYITDFNVARDYVSLLADLRHMQPDAVVHLAQIPSAPFSMRDLEHAQHVHENNLNSTLALIYAVKDVCPSAHIMKLGSMGEYIPSSWYHLTKIHDSANLKWACKHWGLRCTDIMQGPVYGVGGRFDYDEEWGTVINRWVCMGLAERDLLVYGSGEQVRGFLPIQDSMACFKIVLQNPPGPGHYRVINQYAEKYTLNELASMVAALTCVSLSLIHI